MNIEHIIEKPLFEYVGCCPEYGQYIGLYANDLRTAKVGDSWSCTDQDCYPNRQYEWQVTVTVVYKDADGVLLKVHDDGPTYYDYDGEPEIRLVWITVHDMAEETEETKEEVNEKEEMTDRRRNGGSFRRR